MAVLARKSEAVSQCQTVGNVIMPHADLKEEVGRAAVVGETTFSLLDAAFHARPNPVGRTGPCGAWSICAHPASGVETVKPAILFR